MKPGATAADVRAMRLDEAKRIYRAKYWDVQRCDELPAGVDDCVFDYGVNSGIGRSGKVLRRCLKLPANSSAVTDQMIAAARATDAKALIVAICSERLRFLRSLRTWRVFGRGWGRRVAEVKAFALRLADGAVEQSPASQGVAHGKGHVPQASAAQRGSVGAVVVAGSAAAQRAHQSGASMHAVVLIALVAVAAALGVWRFWHWRQRRLQDRPA